MKFNRLVVIAITVMMGSVGVTTALAGGTWLLGGGVYEPSTSYDTAPYMPQDANTALGADGRGFDKAYFNAYVIHYAGYIGGVSYDGNMDGGSIMSPYTNRFVAMLGFWRDCNGDGYVGAKYTPMAYGSFSTYAVSASPTPIDSDVCPPGSPYQPINPETGQPNGFIDEFRWIGPEAGCDASYETGCEPPEDDFEPREDVPFCVPPNQQPPTNTGLCSAVPYRTLDETTADAADTIPWTGSGLGSANDVTDNASRVWGDWERPGHPHVPYGPLTPLPRGTFNDAHGTLGFIDDATLQTFSSTLPQWNTIPNIGHCEQPNPVFLGGDTGTCGAWPLWQMRRAVNDTTCSIEDPANGRPTGCSKPDPIVTVWDLEEDDDDTGTPCDDTLFLDAPNPTNNQQLARVQIPGVDPQLNPNALADGSLSGTYHWFTRGFNLSTGAYLVTNTSEAGRYDCADDGGDIADPFETDAEDSQRRHVAPSMVLNFTQDLRYQHLAVAGFYDAPVLEYGNGGGGMGSPGPWRTPGWTHNVLWTARPPRTGWGYTATTWSTFYADVTGESFSASGADPATALPGGGQDRHVYGVDFCGAGFTTGGTSNVDANTRWECNIDEWERTKSLHPEDDRSHWGAVIGDPYDLRDVDCYDNTVSDQNAFLGNGLQGIRLGVAACPAA